ncbi:MAG: glutamine--fructose-6-phosphate transaminase (isomerizing) [Alphaproteobacteria bacterium]
MCGIVGVVGKLDAVPRLIEGLERLEYRGYDSAGIATVFDGNIERRRAKGRIKNLSELISSDPIGGKIGIGHTRWATHGRPTEANAHPHGDENVVLVHNGIIENFVELRGQLEEAGIRFKTETDTEVIVHLISRMLSIGKNKREAVIEALKSLKGAFALAILFAGDEEVLFVARRGSPLAIGYGEGEMFVGSDSLALAPFTQRVSYLEEGDWAEINREGALIFDSANNIVDREISLTAVSGREIGKGNFEHFMLKEIYEQPSVIAETLSAFINPVSKTIELSDLELQLPNISRVTVVACGTSFYAGLTAKYWIEQHAKVPVECDTASEFRYRELEMEPGGLAIFISQSGETADTLAALRYCKEQGQFTLAIVNVGESTMAREADALLMTHAGPEIGVASTKAFVTQLSVLACLTIFIAQQRKRIDVIQAKAFCDSLVELPSRINAVLSRVDEFGKLAKSVSDARDVLYLGRGSSYPIALEGALKLKEISYIHAEGYAAGEMKHGPIALIDESVPVIVIAPNNQLFEKTVSNTQEVLSRGGRVILFSDGEGIKKLGGLVEAAFEMPHMDPFVDPILYTIPVQLLAYYTALEKKTDVDRPRNLAKSVTVE